MDLLSYLAPSRLTATLLGHALGSADMLANKYRAQMPDDVGIAWRETMRPALVRWHSQLTTQESTHVQTPRA